jgi:hypothetical protein
VLNIVSGKSPADEFLNEIIRRRNFRLPQLSLDVCKNILSNCVVQAFADSNIAKSLDFKATEIPLWNKVRSLNEGESNNDFTVVSMAVFLPPELELKNSTITFAGEAVLEEFLALEELVTKMDNTGEDWSFKLRTFALPRSDKSILDKGDYTLSKAAKSFGNLVEEQLMILQEYPQLLI